MQSYTPKTIGDMNKKLILDLVRESGPLSRADICRILPLSFPAVSANVSALLEEGLLYVDETAVCSNAAGRKSVKLCFNAAYGYVIGISLERYGIRQMLCDIAGNVVATYAAEQKALFAHSSEIVSTLIDTTQKLLRRGNVDKRKILHISVSIPGSFEKETGDLKMCPNFPNIRQQEMETAIHEVCGDVPILFENNVNFGALGEQMRGAGQGYQDIFYLHYDTGLGGSSILDGKLYRGHNCAAGEIGYMLLGEEFSRTSFHASGSAEDTLAGRLLSSLFSEENHMVSMDELMELYKSGHDGVRAAVDKLIARFGILLINTTAVLNPQIIIVSGYAGRRLFPLAQETWNKMLQNHVPYPPILVPSNMRGMESLHGAVMCSLSHLDLTSGGREITV